MKWLYRIICAILIVVMAVSGYKIWSIMSEYKEGEDAYGELEQYVSIPSELPVIPTESAQEEDPDSTPAPQATENLNQFPVVDFNSLKGINPDVMAWIYIPGTHVNYPVVQGEDNEYYLNRLFTGKWNSAGAIFMDYRNEADLSDAHTIIYGHQMNNRTMFHDLKLYEDQEFYDEQPIGYLLTPQGTYLLEFFSGYVSSVDTNAWQLNFTEEGSFTSWLEDIQGRSAFTSDVKLREEDRVITLSTCSSAFENARFVLHARLVPAEIN